MSEVNVDRAMVRRLVEDFWRSLTLFGHNLGAMQTDICGKEAKAKAIDFSRRFEEQIQATAALMQPEQAQAFLKMVEEEDSICFNERQQDYDAFCRRLGINLTSSPAVAPQAAQRRQGLGELAVRTAVRASVWELIWSLFRR
jgi:hypothetical protein